MLKKMSILLLALDKGQTLSGDYEDEILYISYQWLLVQVEVGWEKNPVSWTLQSNLTSILELPTLLNAWFWGACISIAMYNFF